MTSDTQMDLPYFECKPTELCEGAACCSHPEMGIAASLGDYIRLSEHTGQPIDEIWVEKGNVVVAPNDKTNPGIAMALLGILHDPCPYLAEDFKCSVYDMRPLHCSVFPADLLTTNSRLAPEYGPFRCLNGVQMSPEHSDMYDAMADHFEEESLVERTYLWQDQPPLFRIRTNDDVKDLTREALHQLQTNPLLDRMRLRRVHDGVQVLRDSFDKMRTDPGYKLHMRLFITALEPIVYAVIAGEVTRRLKKLKNNRLAIGHFRHLNARYYELLMGKRRKSFKHT